MSYKYLLKLFLVFRGVDFKKAIKNSPDDRAQIWGEGAGVSDEVMPKAKVIPFFLNLPLHFMAVGVDILV